MGSVDWKGILLAGWPVLSILFVASVISVGIIIEKWKTFSKIEANSLPFLESIRKTEHSKVLTFCQKSDQPLALIAYRIFTTSGDRDEKEKILARCIQSLVHNLETKIATLGTIASVAPFVGLLGTVIGIIKAFQAVAVSTAAGAGGVAIGISEALVGTAAGLVVAIPALLAYNFFVNKIRRLTQDWELTGADIIDLSLSR